MTDDFLSLIQNGNSVKEFTYALRQGIPSAVFGVNDSYKCFLISILEGKVLLVVKDRLTALKFKKLITEFSNKEVAVIPAKDEILLSNRAFSKENSYERTVGIYKMLSSNVIIATPDSLMQTFPKQIYSINFELGIDYIREEYLQLLIKMGYSRVDSVESSGTFTIRGDILEIFPINHEYPFKVEFFGDTVEVIKQFNPETREVIATVNSVEIIQATDIVFSNEDVEDIEHTLYSEYDLAEEKCKARMFEVNSNYIQALKNNDFDIANPLCVLSKNCAYINDLLVQNTTVIIDEPKRVYELASLCEKEFLERLEYLKNSGEIYSFSHKALLTCNKLFSILSDYKICSVQTLATAVPTFNPLKTLSFSVGGISDYRLNFAEAINDVKSWLKSNYKIAFYTGTEKRAVALLKELAINVGESVVYGEKSKISVLAKPLETGFIDHENKVVIIGSGNLYLKAGTKNSEKPKRKSFFNAPEIGDYAVHEVHGIGKVLGSKKISTTEGTKDYIAVEYMGGDVLYVPVEQMDILTRYLGSDKHPKLSKIGGKDFERIKKNVVESIKKMSFDLKKLYEERSALQGFEFVIDKELQTAFEKEFIYEETLDQLDAINEIKQDMACSRVMDRLVCGDVGFGKTEVAFRAIFIAVANGKQCALLAPTTILTEQHYNTAIERFKNFGIRIAVLNRFRTDKQQRKILEDLKNGEIDFIIGTHRLLSKDVEFKNLGLLVLDEEQRFGVEHKEKIKTLKRNVDTLTLTATPIPRTLHMSLSGIRSISVINTPPKDRLPVQTYVTEETDTLIKDAILKEINRGGQVFVLYNRVESIFTYAEKIKKIVPNVKLTVVHGQMDERTIENNVMGFYRGESDVLVSTTIIENGIDLPKANTIIIIEADRLGLSTLYQLKGRVGRSNRLAYAYFTFKPQKVLTDTAYERLNAIMEFASMGSGIKVAMRDLEIRGSGNVLGREQHGHMDKIGYELYAKLLKEELTGEENLAINLNVKVNSFIREDYIRKNSARMDAYKEIAEIDSEQAELATRKRLMEAYGEIPEEVDNLINIAIVKRLASKFKVLTVNVESEETSLEFESFKEFANGILPSAVDGFSKDVVISASIKPKIKFKAGIKTNREMLFMVREFLTFADQMQKND